MIESKKTVADNNAFTKGSTNSQPGVDVSPIRRVPGDRLCSEKNALFLIQGAVSFAFVLVSRSVRFLRRSLSSWVGAVSGFESHLV
jgi:hypothetical protein